MKRKRSLASTQGETSTLGTPLQHWPRDLQVFHLWILLQYDIAEALSTCFNSTENPRESCWWFLTTISEVLGVKRPNLADATRGNLEQVNQGSAARSFEEQSSDTESNQIPKFKMSWTLRGQLSRMLHEKVKADKNFTFDFFLIRANQILNGSVGEPHVEVNNLVQGPMFYGVVIKREMMRRFCL